MASLQDRLGPWHGVLFVSFCLGAGLAARSLDPASVGLSELFLVVVTGLFAAFGVHVTLGTVWGYVDGHRQSGGDLADPTFLAPFALAAVAGLVAVGLFLAYRPFAGGRTTLFVAQVVYVGFFVGFCAFVLGMGVVTVVTNVRAGYEETRSEG